MAEDIVVNGVTYNGVDSIAMKNKEGKDVRYFADAVRYMAQTLTEEQKAQARANIGAAAVGEGGGTGTGGTSIDVTAEVGQTIVVREVDENGKPTAWEAAEYQPRTHWKTETVKTVLESTELPFVEDTGTFVLMDAVDVVAGNTYTVNWNGTEYTCTAIEFDLDGIPAAVLGDIYTATGGEVGTAPTGEPFLAVVVPADYAEMVGMGLQVMPLDGAESVTLAIDGVSYEYHQLDSRYIKDMYRTDEEVNTVFADIEIPEDTSNAVTYIPTDIPVSASVGDIAIFTLDGVVYEREWGTLDAMSVVYVGNPAILFENGVDTGEPFLIAVSDGVLSIVLKNTSVETHIISLKCIQRTLHKIDEKYLPFDIGDYRTKNESDVFYGGLYLAKEDISKILYPYTLYGRKDITSLPFTNIDIIGESALAYSGVTSVVDIAIKQVGVRAFFQCLDLKKVDLNSALEIGMEAFYLCRALTTVRLESVEDIAHQAFCDCTNLISCILSVKSNKVCDIASTAFVDTPIINGGAGYIYVPSALIEQYRNTYGNYSFSNQFRALEDYTVNGDLDPDKI